MKAVIIAAGEGKRLRPFTLEKPKPLIEVKNKPLIQHIWETLPDEITEVILVVGYKSEMIQAFIGNEFLGKRVTYVMQKEPWGTGHALKICQKYLENDKKFLLLYADDLQSKQGIKNLLQFDSALLVYPVTDPTHFGVVVLRENGTILDIEEKPANPKSNLAVTGVYVLAPKIFSFYKKELEGRGEYYLTDLIKSYIQNFECHAVESDFWIPIGYPEDLARAEKILNELSTRGKNAIL